MKIARVFPRRTKATPTDDLAFVGPPGLFPPEVDEVHISVAFSWDLREAERLERTWRHVAPTAIGGPATGMPGEEFTPGLYLQTGYVITSRGCPNRCWFCEVPKREGPIRELPIREGKNLLDDNILACSENHVRSVFAMMGKQPRAFLTGGLEAARIRSWQVEELVKLNPERMYFAYDTKDDLEPLIAAGRMLIEAGFKKGTARMRAYVLVGFPKDTIELAERRMNQTIAAGFVPLPMLWKEKSGRDFSRDKGWQSFKHYWNDPYMRGAMVGNYWKTKSASDPRVAEEANG
jgi:hypothetical protein